MVLMLIAGSTVLGHFLAVTRIPLLASEWVVALPVNRHLVMVVIALIYLAGASSLDDFYCRVGPFLAGLVFCAALLFLFPQLATWLPGLLMK